ncbi:Hypothetical predicted protein, partial [Paramuricea clavata]
MGVLVSCQTTPPELPQANPAMEKDDLIRHFQQGYSNNEIAVFLALHHGIVLCVRTIKRILKRLNLKRASKRNHSSVESIIRAILRELDSSSGSFLGYRLLTQCPRRKYNLNVTEDIVMTYIRFIDP